MNICQIPAYSADYWVIATRPQASTFRSLRDGPLQNVVVAERRIKLQAIGSRMWSIKVGYDAESDTLLVTPLVGEEEFRRRLEYVRWDLVRLLGLLRPGASKTKLAKARALLTNIIRVGPW